jgi:hypothetical protein
LRDTQLIKLKQLSVITILQKACQEKQACLSYDVIQNELGIESTRAVEDLLISVIYAGIVPGQLCQKSRTFLFDCAAGGRGLCCRDVPLSSIGEMLEKVHDLQERLLSVGVDLQTDRNRISQELEQKINLAKLAAEYRQKESKASAHVQRAQRQGSGWGSLDPNAVLAHAEAMDLSAGGASRRPKRSRGGLMGDISSGFGRL